jgi:plasmid stabilization system protein ParE
VGRVGWSDDAVEDLHRISNAEVCSEVIDLAETELDITPARAPTQGTLVSRPNLWWRRAVRRADVSQFLSLEVGDNGELDVCAHDYVIVYRLATADERIKFWRKRNRLVVLRVLHNRDLRRHYGEP